MIPAWIKKPWATHVFSFPTANTISSESLGIGQVDANKAILDKTSKKLIAHRSLLYTLLRLLFCVRTSTTIQELPKMDKMPVIFGVIARVACCALFMLQVLGLDVCDDEGLHLAERWYTWYTFRNLQQGCIRGFKLDGEKRSEPNHPCTRSPLPAVL